MKLLINSFTNYFRSRIFQSPTGNIHSLRKRYNSTISYSFEMKNSPLSHESIPSAHGLPLIGTRLDLFKAGPAQLHRYIDKRHKELGVIFREKLGHMEAVFLSSPALMRSLFLYEGRYPTHPLPDPWVLYNRKHSCKRGLFFMNGEEWLHNRRIMNKILLTGNLSWMYPLIHDVTENLLNRWQKEFSRTSELNDDHYFEIPNIERDMYRWSINVIISLMFGRDINEFPMHIKRRAEIFSQNVHRIFDTSSKLMNFPPEVAEYLGLSAWKDFETTTTNILKMGNEILDVICSSSVGNGEGLLKMMQQGKMSMDAVNKIFTDLVIAAADTTSFSTLWTLYLVAKSKEIQERAREDILRAPENDIDIPYIKGIIRETLRLYPVAPFIGRFLPEDAILGNYKVKKDTLVVLSLFTSGRDERNFPDPLECKPDRWFRNSKKQFNAVTHAHGTLPFALGSRSCIGRKIALAQMHSIIKKIVTEYELVCLNENDVDVILRLIAVPDTNVRLALKPRM